MNWKIIFIQKGCEIQTHSFQTNLRGFKKTYKYILLIVCMSLTAYSQAFTPKNKKEIPLKIQIQKILKTQPRITKNIGLVVFDLHSKTYDFAHNEHKLFIPASLSKIVTASAVMSLLNPYHQFETLLTVETPIDKEGVLKDHLYLKGGGDPSFVSENLWILINNLTRSGLKKVEGNLIVDESLFNQRQPHEEWLKSDRSYSAPVSALSFNWNSVNVYIRPALQKGKSALVFIDPQNTYIEMTNKTRTKGRKNKIRVERASGSLGDNIEVSGNIPLNSKELVIYKNITKPALWAGYNAIEFLKQRNIVIEGQVLKGKTPSQNYVLSSNKGSFIFRIVQDMMKFSSNFLADMLTFHLALLQGYKKDLWNEGLKQIHQHIEKQGITDYIFVNPSGLSRKNKMKVADILKFLIQDYHSVYSFEKLASYPVPSSPGTLKKRFKNLENSAFIRAKTGWLSGIVGLAGYIKNKKGQMKAFVFIYNGHARKQMKAQEIFDQLAVSIIHH